jgi:hypothetical protein
MINGGSLLVHQPLLAVPGTNHAHDAMDLVVATFPPSRDRMDGEAPLARSTVVGS